MTRIFISRLIFCLLLTGVVLGAVLGGFHLIERRTPYVDFSRNSPHRPIRRERSDGSLRFAVAAMLSAEESFITYRRLVKKISRHVGKRDVFVLRPTYAEVRRALERGDVDVALICTGVYIHSDLRHRIDLIARPVFEDGLYYRSAFIVRSDSGIDSLHQLKDTVLAYTDPESHTGYLVPRYLIHGIGHDPDDFYRQTIFTGSHDRSIKAVAMGTVDAAAIDHLVLESIQQRNPGLASQVKVIYKSDTFGAPPVAAPAELNQGLRDELKKALLQMHTSEEGREILSDIGIKKFVPARPEHYKSAIRIRKAME